MTASASQPELACVVMSLATESGLVEAVRSLLNQDTPAEIVVVNSGGGDPEPVLRAAGITVPVINRAERLFSGAARNLGLGATKAPFISFLSADCIAEPGFVRARLQAHKAGADAVSCAMANLYPHSVAANAHHLIEFGLRLPETPDNLWLHYGLSYRRELFDRFGPFREDLRTGEDTEFNQRIATHARIVASRDARMAHRNPTTLGALLRDHYVRGARRAAASAHIPGLPSRFAIARSTLLLHPRRMLAMLRDLDPAIRGRYRRCLPWFFAAVLARTLGVLVGRADGFQPRPRKIYALTPFRNAMRYLPGYFENVVPQVDGIVLLDDGSTDGSAEFAMRQPKVLSLLHNPPRNLLEWDSGDNYRKVREEAARFEPDWLLVIDADERVERHFRIRALNEIARAEREGWTAYGVILRDLWDSPQTYRADGMWGRMQRARLYKWRPDAKFDARPYHGSPAPIDARIGRHGKGYPEANLILYHLKMIRREDRAERRHLYETLDPKNEYQEVGYAHLTDEAGLRLEPLPRGRDYAPLAD